MKSRLLLAVAALAMSASAGLASPNCQRAATSPCADGKIWDAATESCITPVNS